MELNFYSELSDGCTQNVDSEFLDSQAYVGYHENKFPESGDSYLSMGGAGHPFLSAEQTFHTPSLGDEVFEIPPISLDPDQALAISDAVAHFELSDGSDSTGVSASSRNLVSNLVAEANDPSFASTFINSGSQSLDHISLEPGGSGLLSSSALELGNSSGSHFSGSSPMTIDVQLADIGPGLLGSNQLATINQSELVLGLGGGPAGHPDMPEQPLSATPSPVGSLQDEDMNDFRRSVLVEPPLSFSTSPLLSHMSSHAAMLTSTPPAAVRRSGGKPAALASATEVATARKGRKKKDPNEPQKPVSAYALFFRDTQAAIKGQNPNASFGEVSKIVASMWDSLAEDQKQVYKRKTEAAKKEYLKALAAYKASQLSQPVAEDVEPAPLSPALGVTPTLHATPAPLTATIGPPGTQTVPNICTQSPQTITKIIIPKHMLQPGTQVVTVLPGGGVRTLQPTLLVSGASRQPPPLQQMQSAPPPPRLQQMAPAPPPLQAKPKEGGAAAPAPITTAPLVTAATAATPPPPLQIKIVPATIQDKADVIVASDVEKASGDPDEDVTEVLHSEEDDMEVNGYDDTALVKSMCVRAGCNNPAVDSEDWDKEYCSNECVATHCRDVFQAWCSIRNQSMGTVK